MIGEQLHRDGIDDRRHKRVDGRQGDGRPRLCLRLHLGDTRTVGEEGAAPGHDFLDICRGLVEQRIATGCYHDDRHILVNERDKYVSFRRISFGVDIGNFLSFSAPSSAMG